MQPLNNSVGGPRVMHLPWQRGTAGFRLMALLEDGRTMLIQLADSYQALRQAGNSAVEQIELRRQQYWSALRAERRSQLELDDLRPTVISVYSENWVGKLTDGGWQTLTEREGGYYRAFRPQPRPADVRLNGRRRDEHSRVRNEARRALRDR